MTYQGTVSEYGNKTFFGNSTPAMVEGASFFTFNYKHMRALCRLTPSSSFDEQKHSHLLPYENHMNYLWQSGCKEATPPACTHGSLAAAVVLVTFIHFLYHLRFNWWTLNWFCSEVKSSALLDAFPRDQMTSWNCQSRPLAAHWWSFEEMTSRSVRRSFSRNTDQHKGNKRRLTWKLAEHGDSRRGDSAKRAAYDGWRDAWTEANIQSELSFYFEGELRAAVPNKWQDCWRFSAAWCIPQIPLRVVFFFKAVADIGAIGMRGAPVERRMTVDTNWSENK